MTENTRSTSDNGSARIGRRAVIGGLGAGVASLLLPSVGHAAAGQSFLAPGQELRPNQTLVSASGAYTLKLRNDGKLVLYGTASKTPYWDSNTTNAKRFVFQSNGNVTLRTALDNVVWETRTDGKGSRLLRLTDAGSLSLFAAGTTLLWDSKPKPMYHLYPEKDAVDVPGLAGDYLWGADPWSSRGFAKCNCTDYVAWWLQSRGVPDTATRGQGNGGAWSTRGGVTRVSAGQPVRPGDVYVEGVGTDAAPGHVGIVLGTTPSGRLITANYNGGNGLPWNRDPIERSTVKRILRFRDFDPHI